MLLLLYFLDLTNTLTGVQLNLAVITLHFNYASICQTATQHFEASLHVKRMNWMP